MGSSLAYDAIFVRGAGVALPLLLLALATASIGLGIKPALAKPAGRRRLAVDAAAFAWLARALAAVTCYDLAARASDMRVGADGLTDSGLWTRADYCALEARGDLPGQRGLHAYWSQGLPPVPAPSLLLAVGDAPGVLLVLGGGAAAALRVAWAPARASPAWAFLAWAVVASAHNRGGRYALDGGAVTLRALWVWVALLAPRARGRRRPRVCWTAPPALRDLLVRVARRLCAGHGLAARREDGACRRGVRRAFAGGIFTRVGPAPLRAAPCNSRSVCGPHRWRGGHRGVRSHGRARRDVNSGASRRGHHLHPLPCVDRHSHTNRILSPDLVRGLGSIPGANSTRRLAPAAPPLARWRRGDGRRLGTAFVAGNGTSTEHVPCVAVSARTAAARADSRAAPRPRAHLGPFRAPDALAQSARARGGQLCGRGLCRSPPLLRPRTRRHGAAAARVWAARAALRGVLTPRQGEKKHFDELPRSWTLRKLVKSTPHEPLAAAMTLRLACRAWAADSPSGALPLSGAYLIANCHRSECGTRGDDFTPLYGVDCATKADAARPDDAGAFNLARLEGTNEPRELVPFGRFPGEDPATAAARMCSAAGAVPGLPVPADPVACRAELEALVVQHT